MDAPSNSSGNDTYNATGATLGAQDSIDGGAGTDKLVIVDTTKASEAGLAAATIKNVEALELNTNGGLGVFEKAAQSLSSGAGEVLTVTPTYATSAFTAVKVTINGRDYSSSHSGSNTSAAALGDAIAALVTNALGDSVTVGSRDSTTGAFTVTAKSAGADIPNFSVTVTGGASSGAVATSTPAAVPVTTAGQEPIQQIQLGGTAASTDTYSVNYVSSTAASKALVYTGDAQATAASAIASQINALYGKQIASAAGTVVTIKGEVGVPLPFISITMGGTSVAATAVLNRPGF